MASHVNLQPIPEAERQRASTYREKSVFLLAAGALVLLAHGVDMIRAGGANWPAFAVRVAWCTLLLAQVATLRWCGRAVNRVMSVASSLGTSLLYLALLYVTGRSGSPLFSFAYVLAIILPMILIELPGISLFSSALLVVGAWTLLVLDGAAADALLGWAHVGVIAFVVGWLLSLAFRRMHASQEASRRARQEAMAQLNDALEQNQQLVADLREALASVRTLSGLLPICAFCKNVRNDQGYWERIEGYISEHSDAQFSHGLCPDCIRKNYPDVKPDEPAPR